MAGYERMLSDIEIQEVIRLLEVGKPLPERYRSLEFRKGRQVEAGYNGKTGHNGKTDEVRLPFQASRLPSEEPRILFAL